MDIIEIDNFLDFHKAIVKYTGSNFLFRGQSNSDWDLIPKVGRPDFRKNIPIVFKEDYILEAWKRYASHQLTKQPIDEWDWISLAQHHGLVTRLLDWTKNPLIALFFATFDFNEKVDSSVFILDFDNYVINTKKITPFEIESSGVFYPKGLSARVISQRGVFTISHKPEITLEKLMKKEKFIKLKIKGASKKELQIILEQYGINEFSIYQDLDNLSNYLNRFILKRELDKII